MAYSSVSDVRIARDGADLLVTWTSAAADGTVFQLYYDRALVWSGTDRRVRLPYDGSARHRVDVGSVAADEGRTDFSGSLPTPAGSGDRVTLTWQGGTYLDPSGLDDVVGFKVFGSAVAGGPISYAAALADIPAYGSTTPLDGFGLGGFGEGGFGRSSSDYSWTSDPLSSGTWSFAIKPYDAAGNLGTGSTTSVTISAPPRPPAAFSDGTRLHYSYNPSTHVPTLTWNASP